MPAIAPRTLLLLLLLLLVVLRVHWLAVLVDHHGLLRVHAWLLPLVHWAPMRSIVCMILRLGVLLLVHWLAILLLLLLLLMRCNVVLSGGVHCARL
jgi:hypothetical protein